jgi:hypothetical protein
MQKFSIKYLQAKFNNTLKLLYNMIKLVSFQEYKNVSIYANNKQNTAHKQNKGQKSHHHLYRCKRAFDKIQHIFMTKAKKKLGIEAMYLDTACI